VLLQRFDLLAPHVQPWIDLSGVASLFNDSRGEYLTQRLPHAPAMEDVRLRVGLIDPDRALVNVLLAEVESLYTNGPAGGGGVRRHLGESITTQGFLIARDEIKTSLEWY
jgi:hypothetical protein